MKREFPANDYQPNAGQPDEPAPRGPEGDGEALDLEASDIAPPDAAAALNDEIVSLNDKILRLAAELENTRRRGEREKQDAGRYAIAAFARDLLNVADAFERALALTPADRGAATVDGLMGIIDGIKLAENSLLAVLDRHGVKRINPKGEKFDPNLHQAVAQAPGDVPAGCVLDVALPGFVIGERVLRAAMVVVSTGPAKPAEPEPPPMIDPAVQPGSRVDTKA
jgi:molecular chaperone GrpE